MSDQNKDATTTTATTEVEGTWYFEKETELWQGQRFGLRVTAKLDDVHSEFQHIQVFDTATYGRLLVLDGVIQLTQRDEFCYSEQMAHIPLFAHANPERVCIIGGGDGAILTQVLQHTAVKKVTMCEIDKGVVEYSRKHFPEFAGSFDDARTTLLFADGAAFLRNHKDHFDVVIVDSSDPIGPAETLFEESFFATVRDALRADGILCTQGESLHLHQELIARLVSFASTIFTHAVYASTMIPTYPGGQIGHVICGRGSQSPAVPQRTPSAETLLKPDALRYYTAEMHRASFVLPAQLTRLLDAEKQKKK